MNSQTRKTVFVGLSGGVDSSVAALRLLRADYNVVGVFIKVWQPDFIACSWEAERLDAMRVAAKLSIPFLTCDAEEAYKQSVADYFIREYTEGRTPNPDVMCNTHVKFGAFLDYALNHGADYIATGHYASREANGNEAVLIRGIDEAKDQTYFLWNITQHQLQKTLLAIGENTKETIRKEAEEAGLITAHKKDSQGICFLGHIDIPDFLGHYVTLVPGDVLDETGGVVGTHKGALVYTLGQRHGFTLYTSHTITKPHYVIDRDLEHNTITVGDKRTVLIHGSTLRLTQCNWIRKVPKTGTQYAMQFRYRQAPTMITIEEISDDSCTFHTHDTVEKPALGQSCVLYQATECLGGGIISECH